MTVANKDACIDKQTNTNRHKAHSNRNIHTDGAQKISFYEGNNNIDGQYNNSQTFKLKVLSHYTCCTKTVSTHVLIIII